MNQDQFLGMMKIIVPGVLSYVVGKGWVPAGSAGDIGAVALTAGAAIWSYFAHSDSAKIASVTAMPDIAKVVISPVAPSNSAAAVAAADGSQPKVTK